MNERTLINLAHNSFNYRTNFDLIESEGSFGQRLHSFNTWARSSGQISRARIGQGVRPYELARSMRRCNTLSMTSVILFLDHLNASNLKRVPTYSIRTRYTRLTSALHFYEIVMPLFGFEPSSFTRQ